MLIVPPAGFASSGDVVLAQLDFISTAAAATAEAAGGGTVDPFVFRLSIRQDRFLATGRSTTSSGAWN